MRENASIAAAFWLYGHALFDSTAGAEMVVQACFSPQGKCSAHILREIERAKKELLVAVYAFTSDDLASALVQAKKRGVAVQVVVDREFDLANEKLQRKVSRRAENPAPSDFRQHNRMSAKKTPG